MSEQNFHHGSDLPRPKRPIPTPTPNPTPKPAPKPTSQPTPPPRQATPQPQPVRRAPAPSPAPRRQAVPPPVDVSREPERLDDNESTRILPRQAAVSDTRPLPPPVYTQPQEPYSAPARTTRKSGTAGTKAAPRRKASRPAAAPPPSVQQPRQASAPAPKRRRRRGCLSRILLGMLLAFALCFGLYSCVALKCINKLDQVETDPRTVSAAGCLSSDDVRNILLIGSDSRDATRGRSDTMLLVSLNKKTDQMILTSFLRDSYVTIPGHGENRLNAAYSFGGPALLLDTIQQNYKIVVDDYLEVNFVSFASIIDAVGGVEITVTDEEAKAINAILHDEVNGLMGDAIDSDYLQKGGKFKLNGKQALSFSRIRKVGNADFQRTERQREVITQMLSSLKSSGVSGLSSIMSNALPNLSTNMTTGAMYLLSLRAPFLLSYDLTQMQIPADGTWKGEKINGASVLTLDLEANRKLLAETIYGKK